MHLASLCIPSPQRLTLDFLGTRALIQFLATPLSSSSFLLSTLFYSFYSVLPFCTRARSNARLHCGDGSAVSSGRARVSEALERCRRHQWRNQRPPSRYQTRAARRRARPIPGYLSTPPLLASPVANPNYSRKPRVPYYRYRIVFSSNVEFN